jgi:hypothetical protein
MVFTNGLEASSQALLLYLFIDVAQFEMGLWDCKSFL